ncbi:hypothetical protein AB1Y20_001628 [Prymnesium parvum]|uniref:Uncharacterized protein n=1 Tax=Prymnesium parvum TaxID=97485 RepID=A0AB34K8A4_PRYPA
MPRPRGSKNKEKPQRQKALEETYNPLLKKPLEVVGKMIDVPGSHWGSSATRNELNKIYKCAVKDYSLMHRPHPDATPTKAFFLTELGEDGHGGESVDFWMPYPEPFLTFYYKTFPDELTKAKVGLTSSDQAAAQNRRAVHEVEDVGNSQGPSSEREEQASRTLALKFVQLESTTKVPAGKKMAGRTRSLYACTIKEGDKVCGSHITVYGKSTSSIFKHVRRFAARADQKAHSAALEELNKWSSRQAAGT